MSVQEHRGHKQAQRLYPKLGVCAECEVAPAYERHHWDDDQHNNTPTNVVFLCRRCHMRIDGRLEQNLGRVRPQTHCLRGHPLSGDNLYVTPKGWRHCRTCKRLHDARRRPR